MSFRALVFVSAVFFLSSCRDVRIKEHKEWEPVFAKHGITDGCFIMRDNNHESIHYMNKERCIKRMLPASTFKVFNSLAALETAVANDDQLVIKWNGVVDSRAEINKDMTMLEAFKLSSFPYYSEIARRVGKEKMQHLLDTCNYGNAKIGGSSDSFWVNNTLQISADEQVGFLKRMYFAELPISERSQRIVKTMMLQESTPGHKMYYKAGTGMVGDKITYWVVGFAERVEHVKEPEGSMNKSDERNYPYFFAMNFDKSRNDTSRDWMKERIDIVYEALREYGAIK